MDADLAIVDIFNNEIIGIYLYICTET